MPQKARSTATTRIPKLCLHKATGQARATHRGRSIYFGRFGSPEAARRYAAWVLELTNETEAVPITTRARAGHAITVAELVNAYEEYLETTMHGRTADAIRNCRSEAKIAGDLLLDRHAAVLVSHFEAPMLVEIRDRVLARPANKRWCMRTINNRIGRIRKIFNWGVERGIVDRSILLGLQAVSPLRAGTEMAIVHAPVKEAPSHMSARYFNTSKPAGDRASRSRACSGSC